MSIQVPFGNQFADQRFTGHGSEWTDSNLNPQEAPDRDAMGRGQN